MFKTTSERFWAKVDKTETCWLWTAAITPRGYGQFVVDGKKVAAHRFIYEQLIAPIPDGMQLDHLCRIRRCVRPDHCRIATNKENHEHVGVRLDSTSGVRGVAWDKARGRWHARVKHNYKTFHLGRFLTLEEAEAAVIAKRNELFTHNDLDRV